MLTDHGSQFFSELFHDLAETLKLKLENATVKHVQKMLQLRVLDH